MNIKTQKREEIKIVGLAMQTDVFKCQKDAPKLWDKFMRTAKLIKKVKKIGEYYGVALVNGECSFRYIAGVEVEDFDDVPDSMITYTIPSSKYAIFEHKGLLSKLGNTYADLYESVMPKSGLKQKKFWFEKYDDRFDKNSKDSVMELWIAVE
jgi:AraC family transcriptional regulator